MIYNPLHVIERGSHERGHRVVMLVEPSRHELLLVGISVDAQWTEITS
jgi:hypothetical protein